MESVDRSLISNGGGGTNPLCGDGIVTAPETCDDSGTKDGDGCSASCTLEDGWTCSGEPSTCSDVDECANNTHHCAAEATCTNTTGSYTCACDTGYTGDGVTCTTVCGDGIVAGDEACDDGGTEDGDGCSALCEDERVPVVVSGTLSCTGTPSNTGRRVAYGDQDALYVAMNCGGTAYVAASSTGGLTFLPPVSTGIDDLSDVTVAAVPGVAYVAATTTSGDLRFTRSTDGGATWDPPITLDTGILDGSGVALALHGTSVYIGVGSGAVSGLRLHRNSAQGTGPFEATDVALAASTYDVLVDAATGDVYAVSDAMSDAMTVFHIRRSTDDGATFEPETTPPGSARFSDWALSHGVLFAVGSPNSGNIWVIPTSDTTMSTTVQPLPAVTNQSRTITADEQGNAFVVGSDANQQITVQELPLGATAIVNRGRVAVGLFPSAASQPNKTALAIAYTSGTTVYLTRVPL